ncbi:hypothetical protein [Mycobacterium gastri]|uniref:Uncharacterized protein n=1 Tax=Mycobacterium gastri TaxID=1777 RepID=A0A1X1VZ26_MYCGS|nr:hypothetical protein [Mycobacterium gastri]ETW23481.1 hypothetical protein MGAST_13905 [Mycobacterium gastri 'Wayne']ORV75459.1 hypothetical protein AWC07_23665 [Mycobacterium gastri]
MSAFFPPHHAPLFRALLGRGRFVNIEPAAVKNVRTPVPAPAAAQSGAMTLLDLTFVADLGKQHGRRPRLQR